MSEAEVADNDYSIFSQMKKIFSRSDQQAGLAISKEITRLIQTAIL